MNIYLVFITVIALFFIIICIIFMIFMITLLLGAPFVAARNHKVKTMVDLTESNENNIFYDLGSGDGKILIEAAKRNSFKKGIGIEINPILVFLSRRKIKKLGLEDKIEIKWGNIFKANIKDADVVFCFLLQPTNNLLEKKLISQLKPGVKIASLAFTFKNIPLIEEKGEVRIYQIPEK